MITGDTPAAATGRIASLDQFRGFTVWSMILVNFLGGFDACPDILQHHNTYCSLADTIMPGFLFAVGFSFRLMFRRQVARHGQGAAYRRLAWRLGGLALVGLLLYTPSAVAGTWAELQQLGVRGALYPLVKRDW